MELQEPIAHRVSIDGEGLCANLYMIVGHGACNTNSIEQEMKRDLVAAHLYPEEPKISYIIPAASTMPTAYGRQLYELGTDRKIAKTQNSIERCSAMTKLLNGKPCFINIAATAEWDMGLMPCYHTYG